MWQLDVSYAGGDPKAEHDRTLLSILAILVLKVWHFPTDILCEYKFNGLLFPA